MIRSKFSILINAPKEKVWEALWDNTNYEKWTSIFGAGSTAISDWNEGSKIQFIGNDGGGMYGIIEKKERHKEMTFKHLGELKEGKEIETQWSGARESYFLTEANGMTNLTMEMDVTEEFENYFKDTFPKALEIVKQIAEN